VDESIIYIYVEGLQKFDNKNKLLITIYYAVISSLYQSNYCSNWNYREIFTAAMDPYFTPVPVPSAPVQPQQDICIATKTVNDIGEEQTRALTDQGFTKGLANALSKNKNMFPLRIWVVDNSGSMFKNDGHCLISSHSGNLKVVESTRWEEIRECVNYHVQMAGLLETETWFRLLNDPGAGVGPQEFKVANSTTTEGISSEVQNAINTMSKTTPGGVTPLTDHVSEIYQIVDSMRDQLDNEGRKVAIILATDGLPTDNQGISNEHVERLFVESLRRLESLPVWLVIRLCTDEEKIVDFYNSLDDQLELSMDVLDDFSGEAQEVYEHNSWLNYTLPIHRLRELGFNDRVFDMIDERTLTKGELRNFFVLLFGEENFDGVPDPADNWKDFLKEVETMLGKEKSYWNPVSKKVTPLLDLKKLDKVYGDGHGNKECRIM